MAGSSDEDVLIRFERPGSHSPAGAPVEIVERKGLGHPDTLCDGVAEALAVALARTYRERSGGLLHFNLDKVLLAAGEVERGFGGGRILRPMTLYVGDRATSRFEGRHFALAEVIEATARQWFGRVLPRLDVAKGLRVVPVLGEGSPELAAILSSGRAPSANDTSAVVGYAPPTALEQAVLDLEHWLNGREFKGRMPESAQDVKVLAVRRGAAVRFTVAMPFFAADVRNVAHYVELRDAAVHAALHRARHLLPGSEVTLDLNALDDPRAGSAGVYLTLGGSSAEHGDSGEVGRGNRLDGVITLMRPSSAEAAAGKNPVSHVGKIYGVLAFALAREIHADVAGVGSAVVWLVSRIGAPLTAPQLTAIDLTLAEDVDPETVRHAVTERVRERLRDVASLCRALERGEHSMC